MGNGFKVVPCILLVWLLSSCSEQPGVSFFTADQYPDNLSAWGLIRKEANALVTAEDTHIYDLNTPLFTDYALKLRTLYTPLGRTAQFEPFDAFVLPVGSVISKTFFYQHTSDGEVVLDTAWDGDPNSLDMDETLLLETRLLVKQSDGWDALPYIWRGDDAYLAITGDLQSLPTSEGGMLNYLVPSRNQCAGCHATDHTAGDIQPIGIKARHLNKPDPIEGINQLADWDTRGTLVGMPALEHVFANADFTKEDRGTETQADLDHRARSYLDINCGHCHNESGAADTSGLLLDYADHDPQTMGECKPPIAAGRGSGGHLYSIVPGEADKSILAYRMNTTDPGTMMPELGRTLVHKEGHALITQWIGAMQGACL